MSYQTLDPTTEEILKTYPEASGNEIEEKAEKTRKAQEAWREIPPKARGDFLKKAASLLRERKKTYAALITREMGKPITQAETEVEKCAWGCEFYAENGEKFLREEAVATQASKSYVRYDPLGVILGIMPWNYPLWQVFRFAAPALAAGNGVLLKPASNVPACGIAIEEIFTEAGGPPGLFQTLFLTSETAAKLIASPFVQAVSLTGSSRAGSEIASTAGRHLKKTVMELGGSDPFVILKDADLEKTVPTAVTARMQNAGQSCIAAKRFIVSKEIYPEFQEKFVAAVSALKMGDPKDPATEIGPLAREDLVASLHRQVEKSVSEGAKLVIGGHRPPQKGFFYEPTVLVKVAPGMAAFDEETFGPVAALLEAGSDEEALELANHTSYGLGASLWSRDTAKAEFLARRIEAGSVFINGMVRSDPRLPFGGIKQSGYGRELGPFGLHEFVNIKTVVVA
jgi:succinate-semialdehyde dehydrogenase / glutarate-semialdehyde dehydrogenase